MKKKITKTKEKRFFSKTFEQLSQVEKIIRLIREDITSDLQLTLLVKLENSYDTDERVEQLSENWKVLLGPMTNFGVFNNHEIGTVFIGGPLTKLFLNDVDGKKLAEFSEGPYGILRGLGIDETMATNHIRKLTEGSYLLLFKGHYFDIEDLEGVLRELDKVG